MNTNKCPVSMVYLIYNFTNVFVKHTEGFRPMRHINIFRLQNSDKTYTYKRFTKFQNVY